MFDVSLKEPKIKKTRFQKPDLKQQLPVPIESLTGVKANDSIWRFYHGKFEEETKNVIISDLQEAKYIYELGFFGHFANPNLKRKSGKSGKHFFLRFLTLLLGF